MLHRRFALAFVPFALLSLARCQCADPLSQLPEPQIEVKDDQGNSTKTADPWLKIDFGDADSGQQVKKTVTLFDTGRAPLLVTNACLVDAQDADAAKAAGCIQGNAPFVLTPVAGATVKAGESRPLDITFAPHTGGPASLFVQIKSNAVDDPVVVFQLVGRGTDGRLCADPSGLYDFGDVAVGTTATGTITVSNCGVKPVTISDFDFSQNPDSAFTFAAENGAATAGATLAEGDAIVLDVTFTPANPGPYRDTRGGDIHVVTAAPYAAEYDLLLVGNGIVPPACRVHVVPTTLDFAQVAANTSATRQIIIQSVGQCGCTVDSIGDPTPAGAGFTLGNVPALPAILKGTVGCDGDPDGAATAPTSISVDVTYTAPDRQQPQTDNATVDVTTSDQANPVQTVNLQANGGGEPYCQLDVEPVQSQGGFPLPAQGRWGVVEFGRTSVHVPKQLPITVKNIGNTDCTINSVAYDDPQNTVNNEFSVVTEAGQPAPTAAATTVHPGDTLTYFAVFSPTHTLEADDLFGGAFSFGSYSGSKFTAFTCHALNTAACNGVTFTTSDTTTVDPSSGAADPAGLAYSIGFSGTPVAPLVDVIPGSLDFGLVTLDCGSPAQRVTVYNNGGADLVVDAPTIDPVTNPAVFTVEGTTNVTGTFPYSIPAGGSMAVEVRYHATQQGLQTGTLVIPTVEGGNPGPSITVPLQGSGTTDTSQTDTFDQLGDPKVDVLWVVDDSGSMSPYQDQLAQNFSQFFVASNVANADFHIAVTTTLTVQDSCIGGLPPSCNTDADCGAGGQCLAHLCTAGNAVNSCPDDPKCGWYTSCSSEHYLQPSSPNVESQFECNVHTSNGSNPSRPTSDAAEGGFRAAYRFLTPENITDPSINGGFMRDDAKLHVIMVSDEPEQSKGSVDEYIDFFKNLKGFRNSSLVTVSAIAAPDGGCTLADGSTQATGDARYQTLVDAMNGRFQSICNSDWTTMMSQLGLDSLGLKVEFFLSRAAEEASLSVCVQAGGASDPNCVAQTKTSDGAANGWFYDPVDNSVVFNGGSVPPRGSRIVVSYGTVCF